MLAKPARAPDDGPMRWVLPFFLVAASACTLPKPYGEGVAVHTLFAVGGRALDHVDEDELDGGTVLGIEFTSLEAASGWGYEAGWTLGSEDGGGPRDLEAEFDEVHLGLRRTFESEKGRVRPYAGFGGAVTRLEREYRAPEREVTDEGAAAYVHGGFLWPVGHFQLERGNDLLLGLDLKAVVGDDYDALQFALVFGAGG
jgi:hypothetical protein